MCWQDADFALTLFMRTPRPERQNPYAAVVAGVIQAPGALSSDSGASGQSAGERGAAAVDVPGALLLALQADPRAPLRHARRHA